MRALYGPYRTQRKKQLLSIPNGGTGADNAVDAAKNLGLLTKDMIGVPNGLIALDSEGNMVGIDLKSSGNVRCDVTDVAINKTLNFEITDFDSLTTYTISATAGTVVRNGNIIVYKAGKTPGLGTVTINGRTLNINITGVGGVTYTVTKPVITQIPEKTARAYNTFTASEFEVKASDDSDTSGFKLNKAIWILKTDTGTILETAVINVDADNSGTSFINAVPLEENKSYKLTVEYQSTGAASAISTSMGFSTKTVFIHEVVQTWTGITEEVTFGYRSVVSADGSILAVSEPDLVTEMVSGGTVYIYEKKRGLWSNEPVKIYSGTSNQFGTSLDISDDGNTLMIADEYQAYIFKRINGKWSTIPVKTVTNVYRLSSTLITGIQNYIATTPNIPLVPGTNTKVVELSTSGGHVYYQNLAANGVTWYKVTIYKDEIGYYARLNMLNSRLYYGDNNIYHNDPVRMDPDGSHVGVFYYINLFNQFYNANDTDSAKNKELLLRDGLSDRYIECNLNEVYPHQHFVVNNATYYIVKQSTGFVINNPYAANAVLVNTEDTTSNLNVYNYDNAPYWISPDGKFLIGVTKAAGTSLSDITVWNLNTQTKIASAIGQITTTINDTTDILDVIFSKNGKFFAMNHASYDKIKIYELKDTDTPTLKIEILKSTIGDQLKLLDMSLDNMFIVVRDGNSIKLLSK